MSATDFGLVGHPLGHSLSPFIHAHLMKAAGIRGTYQLFDLPPGSLAGAVPDLLENLAGFNCTIPYKQTIMTYLDRLDPVAARIGAVNTVQGRCGYNTDYEAFLRECPPMAGHDVLILGAGGISRTMAFAAAASGAAVWILARRAEQAAELAADVRQAVPGARASGLDTIADWLTNTTVRTDERPKGLLNGTPLGLWPLTSGLPFPPEILSRFQWVYDSIYNPAATRLVLAARSRGIPAKSGLGLLFEQALSAQRIWNPAAVFPAGRLAAVRRLLARTVLEKFPVTIVLAGFMGSGKTQVGKALAGILGCPFADLDELIEISEKKSIPDLFSGGGEAMFRLIERRQLEEALKAGRSQVLATGGGALIDPAAESLVRCSPSVIVHLDLPLDMIRQRVGEGEGRPMIFQQGEERLAGLFRERQPRYMAMADLRADGRGLPEAVAARIAYDLGLDGDDR